MYNLFLIYYVIRTVECYYKYHIYLCNEDVDGNKVKIVIMLFHRLYK